MASVAFGGPLEFGSATYGSVVTRDAINAAVPSNAVVTASIAPANASFEVTSVTAYDVVGGLPVQAGQSDGKTPLHVKKGQAVHVRATLRIAPTSLTPGAVAATLVIHGDTWGPKIPIALHAELIGVDETTPIGIRWNLRGGLGASGHPLSNEQTMPDGLGAFQEFAFGAMISSPDFGAVWLSAPIFAKLASSSVANGHGPSGENIRDFLGYPTGDNFATVERGGEAAIFARGLIVVRASGAAFVVYGAIYGHYAQLGNIAATSTRVPVIGLPISDEESAPGGRVSRFDRGDVYSNSATAWEVHGAIRDRWHALGGPASFLGYPTSDEQPILRGSTEIGRSNTFQNGTIFWSPATGAFECHGAIRTKYAASDGPAGALGFPISNETNTPASGRYNAFEHGFIVFHGSGPYAGARNIGNGIRLTLFSFQDSRHDDFNVQVHVDDSRGQSVRVRMPAGDEYGNGNKQFDPPVIVLAADNLNADYTLDFWMLCIHEKTFGSDDRDGTVTAHYDIDNLWGTADSPLHADGGFRANIKMMPQPQIFSTDPAKFRTNLFWPFQNFNTDAMTWTQFSQTFTNVGEGDLSFNVLPWNWHLWERAFFQLVYRGIASGGNCFGMCLEALAAREARTMFVEPIYDSPDNTYSADTLGMVPSPTNPKDVDVIDQVNLKMGYQVGADFIDWFIGMEVLNDIQDANLAFKSSRDAFAAGNWPMILLSSGALSQDGHVVVPYAWLVSFSGAPPIEASDGAIASQPLSSQTWIMRVANPNYPASAAKDDNINNEIRISPLGNTWSFTGAGGTWSGSKGSDGRILCAPYALLNYEQAMVGDFILGLLQGIAVVIFSGSGQIRQITDEAKRTYFTPARTDVAGAVDSRSVAMASAGTAVATRPQLQRTINMDPQTRIPAMAFVPTYHRASRIAIVPPVADYEIYCSHRPIPDVRWPREPARVARPRTRDRLFNAGPSTSELTYDLATDGRSPYRWNLSTPRMSVDISTSVAAAATDRVTVGNAGSASQTVRLATDGSAAERPFTITISGWRGHDRADTRVYVLKKLHVRPGSDLAVGVDDGGKELWVHNPGSTTDCEVEIFVPGRDTSLASKSNVKLQAGASVRIRPSHWDAAQTKATVRVETFGSHDEGDDDDERRRDRDDDAR